MNHLLRLLLAVLLIAMGNARADNFLDPEQAFRATAQALDARTVEVRVDIAEGYHLYRHSLRFRAGAGGARLGTPELPPGERKRDETFGDVEVYKHSVTLRLPVEAAPAGQPLPLTVEMQGCAAAGLCYPPQTQDFALAMPAAGTKDSAAPKLLATAAGPGASPSAGDETSLIAERLRDAPWLLSMGLFFLFGLGLSLTPCVFPMIPILSGIIAGQGAAVSRGRGLALSAAYVLGMAVSYAAAGVAAGMTGTLLSAALQNPWVLGGFAAVFVLLSLSMFGFYELQLPQGLQTRLAAGAGRLRGGRLAGVFLMGAVSALIVGPCVAAPLAGALLYIGQTGNAVLGGAALFAMAVGMGVPLLLVGVSAGALLPRAGVWMTAVKKVFGVLLLATAVWLVTPVLPPAVTMAAWALLLILPAMHLHALDPLPPQASGWLRAGKGVGVTMLVAGCALVLGLLSGHRDPLQPLAGGFGATPAAGAAPRLEFERLQSLDELTTRVRAAGRPVMVDVYADWCASCKEMERFTFSDPAVQARLGQFVRLKADVTANSEKDRALLKHFGLFGPPGIIFLDAEGREIPSARVVGYQDAPRFLAGLAEVCRHNGMSC